ncbi:MAG: acyl-phosphate glycerol 3-phosphate acyltransferase [Gammaproteobacteria bacterium]|nr:MAG: acyl-phosphate glycerol 3-phosphate acyltransferase [Gammaproteobacteria bacterium]
MSLQIIAIILLLLSYLLGSISSAIIVCKIFKLPDPRSDGSNNPGATNVLRLGGKIPAFITLLGDFGKGLIAVIVMSQFTDNVLFISLSGFFAFLGHLYPLFFKFKGGKGVATSLGVLLGFGWWLGLIVALIWLAANRIIKISSLSALSAFFLAPFVAYFLNLNIIYIITTIIISTILFWRHRSNIKELLNNKK